MSGLVDRLHVCCYGAPRALCGGTLRSDGAISLGGRIARIDAAVLLDPSNDLTWDGCTLDDIELELGYLAGMITSARRVQICIPCLGHVERLRFAARPPMRHVGIDGQPNASIAACGRTLPHGAVTGYTPGLLGLAVPCETCLERSSQRKVKAELAAVQRARAAERKEVKRIAREMQRGQLDASDRAFAWLDEEDADDRRLN